MPIPTTYTEGELAVYMHATLGELAAWLALTPNTSSYDQQITDTLIAYQVIDIASANDIAKLRAIAKREAWRMAMERTAIAYNISADDQRFDREKIHEHCRNMFDRASSAAAQYVGDDPSYSVQIYTMVDPNDPYRPVSEDEGGA